VWLKRIFAFNTIYSIKRLFQSSFTVINRKITESNDANFKTLYEAASNFTIVSSLSTYQFSVYSNGVTAVNMLLNIKCLLNPSKHAKCDSGKEVRKTEIKMAKMKYV